MRIQNISGRKLALAFGDPMAPRIGGNSPGLRWVPAGASITVEDSEANLRTVLDYVDKGIVTIVEGRGTSRTRTALATLPAYGVITLTANTLDGQTFTVGGSTYEFDTATTVAAGNIAVTIGGSAAASATAAAAAINANGASKVKASAVGAAVHVSLKNRGKVGTDSPLVKTGANITVSGATLADGVYGTEVSPFAITLTTTAATDVVVNTGFNSIQGLTAVLRDSAGVAKAYDGAISVSASGVITAPHATDYANGDKLTITGFGL